MVEAGTRLPSYSLRSPNRAVRVPTPTIAVWAFKVCCVNAPVDAEAWGLAARRSRFGERSEYERDRVAGTHDSDFGLMRVPVAENSVRSLAETAVECHIHRPRKNSASKSRIVI